MIGGNPKIRERLRDLPTGYLLDLLADQEAVDETAARAILRERGLDTEEIEERVRLRVESRLPRGHVLWHAGRTFAIASTVLITLFNLSAYYQLLHGDSPLRSLMLVLSIVGAAFGFFLGYKLTTHIYQGAPHHLYCGFPLPVGIVDLQTGDESVHPQPTLLLRMAFNAATGLALTLFPLLLIHHILDS